jgi:hypothetical protein
MAEATPQPEAEIINAIIEAATIGFDRDVFLSSWITLRFDAGGQGMGGFVLGGEPGIPAGNHQSQANLAAEWIVGVLRAAEVDCWSKLPGKAVRVRRGTGWSGRIIGIGHIVKNDRWFEPEAAFNRMTNRGVA